MAPSGGGGVDISAPTIELARELARLERVPNVNSERSHACLPFPLGQVDLAFSRRRIEPGSSSEEAS
jgi:hypothetical protein